MVMKEYILKKNKNINKVFFINLKQKNLVLKKKNKNLKRFIDKIV